MPLLLVGLPFECRDDCTSAGCTHCVFTGCGEGIVVKLRVNVTALNKVQFDEHSNVYTPKTTSQLNVSTMEYPVV